MTIPDAPLLIVKCFEYILDLGWQEGRSWHKGARSCGLWRGGGGRGLATSSTQSYGSETACWGFSHKGVEVYLNEWFCFCYSPDIKSLF